MINPWVVVPTYNEHINVNHLVPSLFALKIDNLSVLIVDDSSPDETSDSVRALQHTYPQLFLLQRKSKSGLGKAYIDGFRFALDHNADPVVQMDADLSHDPNDVPKLIDKIKDADLVIGSRYSHGISIVNWPLSRLILSVAANQYSRLIIGFPIHDSTGGYKAWRASTLREIDFESISADGYGFQIETNFRAFKLKKRIIEVPIIFTERTSGQSKMTWAIIREALLLTWKLRIFGSKFK